MVADGWLTSPRSDLLDAILRYSSSVAIDSGTEKVLVVRECPLQLHGQILGQLPLISADLCCLIGNSFIRVYPVRLARNTKFRRSSTSAALTCHETLLLS